MNYKQDLQEKIQDIYVCIEETYRQFKKEPKPRELLEAATYRRNHYLGMVAEFQEERDLEYGIESMEESLKKIRRFLEDERIAIGNQHRNRIYK